MTARELGRRMDAAEFLERIAFDEIHTPDSWYQTALVCLTAARIGGSKKAKLEDFLPARRKPPPDPRELALQLRMFAESLNARLAASDRAAGSFATETDHGQGL